MSDYVVPEAALNVFENAQEWYINRFPSDEAYPLPIKWLEANASRFHFTDKQILDAAMPQFQGDRCSIERWSHYPRVCGIYFLVCNKQIVYVGQSNCIPRRIFQHRDNLVEFDSLSWFEAPMIWLKDIESYYIDRIKPPYNGFWVYHGDFEQFACKFDK